MLYFIGDQQIFVNKSFKGTDGATYCSQWFTALTDEEKTAVGITEKAEPAAEDGSPVPLADQKAKQLQLQKEQSHFLLGATDWYAIRKAETDTAIPADVTTYRAAVRTACAAREAQIAAVTTTEALETLMKTAPGESGALTQWPEA